MQKAVNTLRLQSSTAKLTRETEASPQEDHPVFLRGVIRLFVIRQAMQKPTYGYAIRKALQQRGYDLSPGTLYPLLHAWEKEGLLKSYTEHYKKRVRVHYRATDAGKIYYTQARSTITRLMGKDVYPSLHTDREHHGAQIAPLEIGFFS